MPKEILIWLKSIGLFILFILILLGISLIIPIISVLLTTTIAKTILAILWLIGFIALIRYTAFN